MRTYLILLAITCCLASAYAQTETTAAKRDSTMQNGWYIEPGGQSIIGVTFNYERWLSKKPGGFSVHVGLGGGYLPDLFDDGSIAFGAATGGLSYNIPLSKDKQHFFELGAGYTYLFSGDAISLGSVITGYRYISKSGNIQVRATLLPVVFLLNDGGGGPVPWVGFSIGKRF